MLCAVLPFHESGMFSLPGNIFPPVAGRFRFRATTSCRRQDAFAAGRRLPAGGRTFLTLNNELQTK
jgi:hypothetical protein